MRISEANYAGASRIAHATYLQSCHLVVVRVEPTVHPGGATFVRTQSIHFDIDPNGDISSLEILGPHRSQWKVTSMQWPEVLALSTIRFADPECCEEEETELFEEDKTGNILRITIPHHTAVKYTSPAIGLVFGLDKHKELAEIWIRKLVVLA